MKVLMEESREGQKELHRVFVVLHEIVRHGTEVCEGGAGHDGDSERVCIRSNNR